MFEIRTTAGLSKAETYRELTTQLAGLLTGETNGLANAANTAALLFAGLGDVNWAGFYFMRGGELVLGPFQGKVACVRLQLGRGVCGTAAQQRTTVVVADVEKFPGHVACDHASRSEIVVPLIQAGKLKLIAVLSAKRDPDMPDIPALAETVPGYVGQSWQGFFARAGTPKPIVDALNAALVADLKKPETATRFNNLGIVAQWDTPDEFRTFIAAETLKWGKIIKAAGIEPQ